MEILKTKLKFKYSERNGNLIGYVHVDPYTQRVFGVKVENELKKSICVLSEDLQGRLKENVLYDVALKQMIKSKGFVVIAATPSLFKAEIIDEIIPKVCYRVVIKFGNRQIYYDPINGKSRFSRTAEGAIDKLRECENVEDLENVIEDFRQHVDRVQKVMIANGMLFN